ncbi:metallophosphoesterase [Marinibactrum halimedae]|uniref:Calcineurin-like phosphoesterase domain-containing protein n=1 Tax=Marinibactrum halimedae TaxID=1444977 RepID=A0AA37TDC0_9GAMM|nr:metallophosphoesterase [Marinibactrum halimedae]MCD9459497.1 metallophosphoesterase [Marinibactrum halimedae]GLS28151.1 hypothetical protein GCM10007877_38700 [Marinibactrum halimedae]
MLDQGELEHFTGYDIIGDVHGCADTLVNLLTRLGYHKQRGVWRHPKRLAVFLGDIIDRGPHIREALQIVHDMAEHNAATMIMGNHEYNAIGYETPAPDWLSDRDYLRPHNHHHNRLIAETKAQFEAHPGDWKDYLAWFKTLPLFIEFNDFRVVHACWDESLIHRYLAEFGTNQVDDRFIINSVNRDSFEGQVMDRLTRGTCLKLPDERVITSRDGYQRRFFRTKFWAKTPITYADVVYQPDPLPEDLMDRPLSEAERAQLLYYGPEHKPLFVGHYWLQGRPRPIRNNIACLDYSAVKFGRLAAYRYDGEPQLCPEKFAWVYVNPPEWRQPEAD